MGLARRREGDSDRTKSVHGGDGSGDEDGGVSLVIRAVTAATIALRQRTAEMAMVRLNRDACENFDVT